MYNISVESQHVQMISHDGRYIARCHNTAKGWIAHRVAVNERGGLDNIGEGLKCSDLINRHSGAELIARGLGL